MTLISAEALPHFENCIYLPMLLTILHRDRQLVQQVPFKLKSPYINLIDETMNAISADLEVTLIYLQRNEMKVLRQSTGELFTEYLFLHEGYQDSRRYLNARLRNRSEELLNLYIRKLWNQNFSVP